jgi:hypothetical protein
VIGRLVVDLTEEEARAVDALVADYAPDLDGEDSAVDLSEGEKPQDRSGEGPSSYFGVEDVERIASQDVDALSEEQRADAELHEDLRRHAHAERFGEDDPNITDEQMWDYLSRAWGLEEK